jgi:protease-4
MLRQFIASQLKLAISIGTVFYSLIACSLVLLLILAGIGAAFGSNKVTNYSFVHGKESSQNEILTLNLHGVIEADAPVGVHNGNGSVYGSEVKQELYDAADDDAVRAVLLDIDSPGGSISGSQDIADGVTYFRTKSKKPIYAHITEEAASGGYWSAVATDKIIADVGSQSGSIGVIMGTIKFYDGVFSETDGATGNSVQTENAIQTTTITAGQYKDTGNPYRELTQAEIDHYQTQINTEYDYFVKHVSTRRNIPEATIKTDIKALLYSNEDAIKLKLIDSMGSREDAYSELAVKTGIKDDDYKVVEPKSNASIISNLVGAATHTTTPKARSTICADTRTPIVFSGDLAKICQ